MRTMKMIACLLLVTIPGIVQADEKTTAQGQIDAAKAAIEAFSRKTHDDKLVFKDIEAARSAVKKGEEAFTTGRQMFGLGDISTVTGHDVKHFTDMVDLYLTLGQSRINKAKAAEELKPIISNMAKVKARLKSFEDRQAELEKLRADQAKFEPMVKELEQLKAENARLSEKQGKLVAERQALAAELESLKAELAKHPAVVPPVAEAVPPVKK